jgi:hypothetical protein
MHKQDENDLEILPSFIRSHVKILWNHFFCIYINVNINFCWESLCICEKYNFENDKRTTIWFGCTCACEEKGGKAMGDFVNRSFMLDASENN